ncbi:MAG: hypothetical protein AABM40_07230 [Chloroflexota bacterium]
MTDEVDPRLVALGLVPGPAAAPAPPDWETAAPPKPTDWVIPTAPAVAPPPPPPPQPSATPSVSMPAHKPLTVGDLFPGMGKFSGTPSPDAPAAQPPPPTFTPAPQSFAPAAPLAQPATPPPPQTFAPAPAYTPPSYTAPVAPPEPEAPVREAPPPLPPLAAAMPTPVAKAVEAPAIPTKKEKAAKPKKEKAAKAEKAAKPAKPEVVKPEKVKAPPKPRFVLPPSGVLLRGPIVMGYPEQKLQITLEQLGFRINAKEPIDVAWTDVREIKSRRGRVVVRTKGRPVAFGIPVEGVAEPTLSGPLARVVKEASGGSLDLAGSSFLELQNATDSLRDHFHDEDDPLVPTVVGLVFGLAGLTFTALLPDALAIATRTPVAVGAYLLDYPLAGFDPRILAAAFAAAAMLAAGIVRVAMGKAATAWARGTLRGWHEGARRPVALLRRGLAAIVLNPSIAAAVLLAAIVMCLPSARAQTIIDESGFHIMRALPFFDDNRSWTSVKDMKTVPAPTVQHFEGVAVIFTFTDNSQVSTLDAHLRGGTDKQLLTSATQWQREAQ